MITLFSIMGHRRYPSSGSLLHLFYYIPLCCLFYLLLIFFREPLPVIFTKSYMQDESKLYIFLELVTQGSLANLYQKYDLRDSQVSAYTRQILNGLKYLHDRNVVHRWYNLNNMSSVAILCITLPFLYNQLKTKTAFSFFLCLTL